MPRTRMKRDVTRHACPVVEKYVPRCEPLSIVLIVSDCASVSARLKVRVYVSPRQVHPATEFNASARARGAFRTRVRILWRYRKEFGDDVTAHVQQHQLRRGACQRARVVRHLARGKQ
jgi:hypothetical protein